MNCQISVLRMRPKLAFFPGSTLEKLQKLEGRYGLPELLKSEKSPGMMKVVLDWCMWGQVTGGSADTMGWGKSWGSSLHSSLRCLESPAPSPTSQQPPCSPLCQQDTSGVMHWWKMGGKKQKTRQNIHTIPQLEFLPEEMAGGVRDTRRTWKHAPVLTS